MEKKMKTIDVVYRKDLYPRFEPDQQAIQRYADSIEYLPPIKVNQDNILIDGFHRWKAHQVAKVEEIKTEVIETGSDKELKRLAYKMNSNHGLQLKNDEKKIYAVEMIEECSVEELALVLSVSADTIATWTKTKRDSLKDERNRKILNDYLHAWTTQEMLAEKYGLTKKAISDIVNNLCNNTDFRETTQTFKPILYNIWNTPKQDNARKYFGAFPEVFMENLLHYHTEPFDIVYDPFGGGGTTVDVCKRMLRRYYVSDRIIAPAREEDIRQHDIANGLPEDLQKPKLVFLDPPYWKQAEGKYSTDAEDLSNMTLEDFNSSMHSLLQAIDKRKIDKIAIVIQPTQFKNNFVWTDHIFDFAAMIPKYKVSMRYILPYSSEQYNAQIVNAAKEANQCLGLNRDLVVFEREC